MVYNDVNLHECTEHVNCRMTDSVVVTLQCTYNFHSNLLTHSSHAEQPTLLWFHNTNHWDWKNIVKRKEKSFPNYIAHFKVSISVSLTPARRQLTLQDHRYEGSASSGVPLYSPAFTRTHCAYHWGMTRLSWPGWLVTYRGSPACRWSPIQVLTQHQQYTAGSQSHNLLIISLMP